MLVCLSVCLYDRRKWHPYRAECGKRIARCKDDPPRPAWAQWWWWWWSPFPSHSNLGEQGTLLPIVAVWPLSVHSFHFHHHDMHTITLLQNIPIFILRCHLTNPPFAVTLQTLQRVKPGPGTLTKWSCFYLINHHVLNLEHGHDKRSPQKRPLKKWQAC